ncbi:hypothetical protein [Aureibaculum luteum]|uniref:hypothetical protein n=1 Tax=Aureibaculum luteum TaxID=1548456 RepID=UPI000E4DB67E|nr:hypothetical protein [Aureibaculum luteum]
MQKIKYTIGLLIFFVSFTGCEEEDNFNYLDEVTAPTNVSAVYDITQDNTGTVTITPNGDGATTYNIYLGDSTTQPILVKQGSSTTHIYPEGSFTIKIEAIGITGLKTEASQDLVVSFKAPENLEVLIENDPAISKQLNVTATADFATMFDVYFGEEGNDDPVTANIGEMASFVYQEPGTYTIKVVAKGAAIETTEITQEFVVTAILQPLVAAPTPTKSPEDVISIYSDAYDNPDPINYYPDWGQSTSFTQINVDGDNMIQYGGLTYQGIDFSSVPLDASAMEYLHIDVWTADSDFIAKLSPISTGPNETAYDLNLIADQWTSFDIPLSFFTDQNPLVDLSEIIQFKFDGIPSGGGTIFVDNLYFYKQPVVATAPDVVAPDPTYNASDVTSIFSDSYTSIGISELNPDWGQTTTIATVNVGGNDIWLYESLNYTGIVTDYGNPTNLSGRDFVHFDYFTPDAEKLGLKLVNTVAGTEDIEFVETIVKGTWVSVTIPLENYAFDRSAVTQLLFDTDGGSAKVYIDNLYFYSEPDSTQPTVEASTPNIGSSDVISVFSDSYTSVGISELNPDWGQSTTLTDVNIGGNIIWKYESLNYTGIVTDYGNPTDLSSMSYVHFDYFTPDATTLGLKLVNTVISAEDIKFVTVKTGTWVSVTIPLENFAVDRSAITQLLFDTSGASATVFIDNLYFHN